MWSVLEVVLLWHGVCLASTRAAASSASSSSPRSSSLPNFIVFFVDDMGYGDLGFTGHPTVKSPNIDRLAHEGMILTSWYSGFHLCGPSRTAILTGRQPVRSGMAGRWTGDNLVPNSIGGLPSNESTFASLLKTHADYATVMVGKWHQGQRERYLPHHYGFDSYLGVPYSVDMGSSNWLNTSSLWDQSLPLLINDTILSQPPDLSTLTQQYTNHVIDFIHDNQKKQNKQPFLVYFAFSHVHVPGFVSREYCNASIRGRYGDTIYETDNAIGQIMETLHLYEIENDTMIFFTSDNGPWLARNRAAGSAGLFRSGKHTTWEGGLRMPSFVYWPGQIQSGLRSSTMVSSMDVLPTMLHLANVPLPKDRIIDGKDMSPIIFADHNNHDNVPSQHECLFFYGGTPGVGYNNSGLPCENELDCPGLAAMRCGPYKLHFYTQDYNVSEPIIRDPPLLFNVEMDPSEQHPIWPDNQDYQSITVPMLQSKKAFEYTVDLSVVNQIERGTDDAFYLCCDPLSRDKYPNLPLCTCDPQIYTDPNTFICDPVCRDEDHCGTAYVY